MLSQFALSLSPQFSMLAVPSVIISPVCCQSMQGDVYCLRANVLSRHLYLTSQPEAENWMLVS